MTDNNNNKVISSLDKSLNLDDFTDKISGIQNEIETSAKKYCETLQNDINRVSDFTKKINNKSSVKDLTVPIEETVELLHKQMTALNELFVKFHKEIMLLFDPINNRLETLEKTFYSKINNIGAKNIIISNEDINQKNAQNIDEEGTLFLEESKDIELPPLKGTVSLFNEKEALYALKDYGNQIVFKQTKRLPNNEEIGQNYAFFKKITDEKGNIAYEVAHKSKNFKMEILIKRKLNKIKNNFKKKGGSDGGSVDFYFLLKWNESQIQFQRQIDKKFDKYALNNFFVQCSENSYSIYIPSAKDKNKVNSLKMRNEMQKRNKSNKRQNMNNRNKLFNAVKNVIENMYFNPIQPQRYKPAIKPQYIPNPRPKFRGRKYYPRREENKQRNNEIKQLRNEIQFVQQQLRRPPFTSSRWW